MTKSSNANMIIEEIEYLVLKIESFREAEDLIKDVNSKMYRDLIRLHWKALEKIKKLVRRITRESHGASL